MLLAQYGFAQSMGYPTQSSDRCTFAQQTMHMDLWPNYNPWIVRLVSCMQLAQSMD